MHGALRGGKPFLKEILKNGNGTQIPKAPHGKSMDFFGVKTKKQVPDDVIHGSEDKTTGILQHPVHHSKSDDAGQIPTKMI
jgi:hypothetical protein